MTRTIKRAIAITASILGLGCWAAPASAGDDPAAEMAAAAQQAYELAAAGVAMGTATPEEVHLWSRRWMEAETGRAPTSAAALATAHLDRMTALDKVVTEGIAAGMMPATAGAAVRYYVAEARTAVAFATSR